MRPDDDAADDMIVAADYPLRREHALEPPATLARLRDGEPLRRVSTPDGRFPWLVTRYDEVRAVLGDDRFSVDPRIAGVPTTVPAMQARNAAAPTFLTLDDPEHARLRRAVTGEFTIRRLDAFRPVVHDLVAAQLDRMAAAPGRATDLVASFSLPLASLVICRLLGVPYADHAFFQDRAAVMMSSTSAPEQTAGAAVELTDFLRGLLDARRDDPTDDLIGRLASEHVATGAVDPDEACAILVLLLVAGHDTTTYAIALSVLRLLVDDAAAARFRAAADAADDETVARSVEELLRLHDVIHFGHARAALADVEVGGTTVRADEGVYVVTAAANRDPRVFPDPGRFDPDRSTTHRHLAFGFGVHQCLGQQLARMELRGKHPRDPAPVPRSAPRHPPRRPSVPRGHDRVRPSGASRGVVTFRSRHLLETTRSDRGETVSACSVRRPVRRSLAHPPAPPPPLPASARTSVRPTSICSSPNSATICHATQRAGSDRDTSPRRRGCVGPWR